MGRVASVTVPTPSRWSLETACQ